MKVREQFSLHDFISSTLIGLKTGFRNLRMRRAEMTRMAAMHTAVMLIVVIIVMLVLSGDFLSGSILFEVVGERFWFDFRYGNSTENRRSLGF